MNPRALLLLLALSAPLAQAASPYGNGPGGPILVITSSTNAFSTYYAEILQAEGLNAFALCDIGSVSSSMLTNYDVAILGNMTLSTGQVTTLSNWVVGGGHLIAMRPDKKLAGLLGLTDVGTTLSEGYLLVNTAAAPGAGIVGETIQFHGTADRYTLSGATAVATLFSNATATATHPAVTLRNVGGNGGSAAAFTYDLARSIVFTRQGNPAWAGQDRDGDALTRSDDLFFGNAGFDPQPDWVNLNKLAIPQADEQQRLLANLILQMNLARRPLPRFWYFPNDHRAVVVMTGDDHGNGGTKARFDQYATLSSTNASVADWQTIRGSSYIYNYTPVTDAQAAAYGAQGFEIGLHVNTGCAAYTLAAFDSMVSNQLVAFQAAFPSLPSPKTHRIHCIAWSGYTIAPEVEAKYGMRFDVNYYHYPASWIGGFTGFMTGSGLPMRFAMTNGISIDVYQAATQMTDESSQIYPDTMNALLDRALGPEGYYGAFVANMHTDFNPSSGSDAIVTSALNRGVPVVSAEQMLTWVDARSQSHMENISWAGNTLTFTVEADPKARGLRAMVPVPAGYAASQVNSNGVPVAFSTRLIKGMQYVLFSVADATPLSDATYQINFAPDTTPPAITATSPASAETGVASNAALHITFSEPVNPATISTSTITMVDSLANTIPLTVSYNGTTLEATATPTTLLSLARTYIATVAGGPAGVKDLAGNQLSASAQWSFATLDQIVYTLWPTSAVPALLGDPDTQATSVGVKFRSAVPGYITGLRFYKGPANTGTHLGSLWASNGTSLASITFSNETTAGWQEQKFITPVAIGSNTTYVASYHAPNGRYSVTQNYFTSSGVTNPPLRALSSPESGGNGVYRYGAPAFPNQTYLGENYWVDVLFQTSLASNTPPQADGLVVAMPEDTVTNLFLPGNDAQSAVTFSLVANPTNGTLSGFNTNTGAITYQPNTNYFGPDAFSYRVSDGSLFATGTVSITVSPVNDRPTVTNFAVTLAEDTTTNLVLRGGDVDGTVTYSLVANPTNGTLSGFNTNTGAITYQPNTNYFGADAFRYRVSDGSLFATGTVSITISPVNDAPTATDLAVTLPEDTVTNLFLPGGDVDSTITYSLVANPTNGTLSGFNTNTGAITYQPNTNYFGPDTFSYSVSDGSLLATGAVSVTVSPVNDAPLATNFAVTLPEDSVTNLVLLGGDVENAVTYSLSASPTNGTLSSFNTNTGAITYQPNTNCFGADAFFYSVSDGSLLTTGMVSLTISPVNDAPTATDLAVTLPEDSVTNLVLLGGDVEGAVTYSLVANPTNGTLNGFNTNTGALTYQPNTNCFGPDAFFYSVSDGSLATTGMVSLTISPVNDAPTATDLVVTLPEDTVTNLFLPGGDVDGTITYSLVANPTNGTLSGFNTNTGEISYQPNTNCFGADTFFYSVSDGSLLTTGMVSLTISPVNDAPTATDLAVTLPEDTVTNLFLPGGDVDSAVTFSLVANPTNGTLSGFNTNTGEISYQPNTNCFGPDAFFYSVSDGSLATTGMVSLTVSPVNDAPTATDMAVTLPEDSVTNLVLQGGDVEGVVTYSLVANPTNGTLSGFNTNTGEISYQPNTNCFGADTFFYSVSDGSLLTTGMVSLTISPVNDAPTATDLVVTLPEDTVTNLSLPGGDVDGTITYSLVANPTNGTLSDFNTNTGALTYQPNTNCFGTDAFFYSVSDGSLATTGMVSLTISPVNDAPTATDLVVTLPEDTVTNLFLPGGDVDSAVTYSLVANPTNGTLSGFNTNTGEISYQPNTNCFGPDAFFYSVSDGSLLTTGAVSVTVISVNDPPVFVGTPTNRTIPELALLTVTNSATEVDTLANALSYALVNPPAGAVIDTNGVITWTPGEEQGISTNELITVVSDGEFSVTNSFEVVVAEVNVAPAFAATPPNLTIAELTLLTVTNNANDSDWAANVLIYSLVDPPTNAVIDTNGVISWMPSEGQGVSTNVLMTVVGDGEFSVTNSFEVIVTEVNDVPVFNGTPADMVLSPLVSLTVTNAATDADLPANTLTYALVSPPTNAVISPAGLITWTPEEAERPSTNIMTTVVNDGAASVTNSFVVILAGPLVQPVILSFGVDDGMATVTWSAAAGQSYVLEYSGNCEAPDWTPVVPGVVATNSTVTVTVETGGAPMRVYRVRSPE